MVVVKPVIALTLADEDEFSENIKQLQRDIEGWGKLTLNNSSMKNCFNRMTLSSFELTVCSFCDNIISHTLQQVDAGTGSFWFTDSVTPGS